MPTLLVKWKTFCWLLFDPWFVVSFLVTVLSLSFSFLLKADVVTSNLLAIFGSASGGVTGGVFQSQWNKMGGENILEKKGQSAVRNLNSIRTQIASLRSWVEEFAKVGPKEKKEQLREVDRHLSTMELHIRSGYQDWIDIVPQLRQEKEIFEKYEQVVTTSFNELLDQKMKLAQAASSEDKKALEDKIQKLEDQLKELRLGTRTGFYGGIPASSVTAAGLDSSFFIGPKIGAMTISPAICPECERAFIRDRTKPLSAQVKCPACRSKEDGENMVVPAGSGKS